MAKKEEKSKKYHKKLATWVVFKSLGKNIKNIIRIEVYDYLKRKGL